MEETWDCRAYLMFFLAREQWRPSVTASRHISMLNVPTTRPIPREPAVIIRMSQNKHLTSYGNKQNNFNIGPCNIKVYYGTQNNDTYRQTLLINSHFIISLLHGSLLGITLTRHGNNPWASFYLCCKLMYMYFTLIAL